MAPCIGMVREPPEQRPMIGIAIIVRKLVAKEAFV
jgi:hypothetical protein